MTQLALHTQTPHRMTESHNHRNTDIKVIGHFIVQEVWEANKKIFSSNGENNIVCLNTIRLIFRTYKSSWKHYFQVAPIVKRSSSYSTKIITSEMSFANRSLALASPPPGQTDRLCPSGELSFFYTNLYHRQMSYEWLCQCETRPLLH